MLGLLSARDVDGLEIANCKFLLPKEGKIYSGSGIMDFFYKLEKCCCKRLLS